MVTHRLTAPAKINLNLHITGRRDDGYHILDSWMVFTQWGDDIAIKPSNTLSFTVDGPYASIFDTAMMATDEASPNLIIRAVHAMAKTTNNEPNIAIHLTKNIPAGAGLGGGSSDAASIILALNALWGHPLSIDQLCTIGLSLGAELPACLTARPCRVQGIGDKITPASDWPAMPVVIAWPDADLKTAQVFEIFRKSEAAFNPLLPGTDIHSLSQTENGLYPIAVDIVPEIKAIIDTMTIQNGCQIARMTGSGSACFGLFKTMEQAELAAGQFKNAVATQTMV